MLRTLKRLIINQRRVQAVSQDAIIIDYPAALASLIRHAI